MGILTSKSDEAYKCSGGLEGQMGNVPLFAKSRKRQGPGKGPNGTGGSVNVEWRGSDWLVCEHVRGTGPKMSRIWGAFCSF